MGKEGVVGVRERWDRLRIGGRVDKGCSRWVGIEGRRICGGGWRVGFVRYCCLVFVGEYF